jgi:hypothetical protein
MESYRRILPPVINSQSLEFGIGRSMRGLEISGNSAGGTRTANMAQYIPFWLPCAFTIRGIFWMNGSTVTGNGDFGIYSLEGVKLGSTGSTALTGISQLQGVTLSTALNLDRGIYFMAAVSDGATRYTNTTFGSAADVSKVGVFEESSVFPLPSTASFGTPTFLAIPWISITDTPALNNY